MHNYRTDLAMERLSGLENDPCPGVQWEEWRQEPLNIHRVHVTSPEGAKALDRPEGQYLTARLEENAPWDSQWMWRCAGALAGLLRPMLPKEGAVLVAGLGNHAMTCDALGPLALEQVMITRHLRQAMPEIFADLRPVCALSPGVLGTTGLESAELLRGVVRQAKPEAVIAIDALAAREPRRLCRTFQLADTGITPGSGACNPRQELSGQTLGVPVIALGVPTVVELPSPAGMLVTPKDIDLQVGRCAKVLGWAVNLAVQPKMTLSEMEQFLS